MKDIRKMEYRKIIEKKIKKLDDIDPNIKQSFDNYVKHQAKLRQINIEQQLRIQTLKKSIDQESFSKNLHEIITKTDRKREEVSQKMLNEYRTFQNLIRKRSYVDNPLHNARQIIYDSLPPNPSNPPIPPIEPFRPPPLKIIPQRILGPTARPHGVIYFDTEVPITYFFTGIQKFDDNLLFNDIKTPEVGPDPDDENIQNVIIEAKGSGKWGRIEGSWCFITPDIIDLVNLELACCIRFWGGLIRNSSAEGDTGYATINLHSSITQYRTNKEWDEIDPVEDIPLRTISPHRTFLMDDTPGDFHNYGGLQDPISSDIYLNFADYYGWLPVKQGDIFFISYLCEVFVSNLSFIDFSYEGSGTIVMERPYIKLFRKGFSRI